MAQAKAAAIKQATSELVNSIAGTTEAEKQEEDVQTSCSDLQLAWEMLEVARVIYTRVPSCKAIEVELARVYMRLGDVGMETGMFGQAKSDYSQSLHLFEKLATNMNAIADIHCCMAMCCVYESATQEQQGEGTKDGVLTLLTEGMEHYTIAGQTMARIIHSKLKQCSDAMQTDLAKVVPMSLSSSNGKGKKTVATLQFHGDIEKIKAQHFAQPSAVEAEVLEALEIFVELKEKAEGLGTTIKEKTMTDSTTKPGAAGDTQIGFGNENKENDQSETKSVTAPPVNTLIPVKKKQKIEGQKEQT